jgi:Holliday junction resolvase RusA-like endonuclease
MLTIRSSFPSLNEVINVAKQHWGQYAKLKKDMTLTVVLEAKVAKLRPRENPVCVVFYWYESNQRRDIDNISAFGTKVILDGLVEAGILQGDGQKQIPRIRHYFAVDKDNPRVEVQLLEIKEEHDAI